MKNVVLRPRTIKRFYIVMAPALLVGSVLDALTNSVSLFSLLISWFISVTLCFVWLCAAILVKTRKLKQEDVHGTPRTVRRLGWPVNTSFLVILFLLWFPHLFGIHSESSVHNESGTIYYEKTMPLAPVPGVTVRVLETKQETLTDEEGNFLIPNVAEQHPTLYVSYLGQRYRLTENPNKEYAVIPKPPEPAQELGWQMVAATEWRKDTKYHVLNVAAASSGGTTVCYRLDKKVKVPRNSVSFHFELECQDDVQIVEAGMVEPSGWGQDDPIRYPRDRRRRWNYDLQDLPTDGAGVLGVGVLVCLRPRSPVLGRMNPSCLRSEWSFSIAGRNHNE